MGSRVVWEEVENRQRRGYSYVVWGGAEISECMTQDGG